MSAAPELGDAAKMLARLADQRGTPLSAGIEISDRCNEVCVHCYQEQGLKGEMSTADLCRVIDQLADMGVLMLTLSGGEATLRKDFLEIVAHARRRGFAVRLFTNGLTMTSALAQELGRLAVQAVEISIYSARAEVHDFVTGVKGSFERSTAGARHLVAAGVGVTIKAPVMSLNEDEVDAYTALADSLGATYSFAPDELMPREGANRAPEAFNLSDRARIAFARRFDRRPEAKTLLKPPAAKPAYERPLSAHPCGAGQMLHIEPNGELRPCTMLEVGLGDALNEGVAAAFSGNASAQALRELTWADLHGCRECDLRSYCQRCYAAALTHTGDALGPYERACRGARLNYGIATGHAMEISTSDRDVMLGPFRQLAPGVFERFDHIISPADDALAARLGWARRSSGGVPAPELAIRPGDLVQIRRPGRTKPRLERIPVGTSAVSTEQVVPETIETERHN